MTNDEIKVGDKVLAYDGRKSVEGHVKNVLDSATRGKIYIVTGDDGELHKCRAIGVIRIVDEPQSEPARLNLTREEFRKKYVDALHPKHYDTGDDIKGYMTTLFVGMEILEVLDEILFPKK